jgi:hypothetical protein
MDTAAGMTADNVELLTNVTEVASVVPNLTVDEALKSWPVMVTVSPPEVRPLLGVTAVICGGAM